MVGLFGTAYYSCWPQEAVNFAVAAALMWGDALIATAVATMKVVTVAIIVRAVVVG